MGEIMLIGALLLVGTSIYLIVHLFLSASEDVSAMSWDADEDIHKSKSKFIEVSRTLVHRFCMKLAKKVKFPGYRKKVKQKITTARLSSEINVDEFIGMQILWGLLFPLLLSIFNFTLEIGYNPVLIVVVGFIGAYFPHLYVNTERNKCYVSVIADLPFFIDLLSLSTKAAGMDFITAIQRVVDKAEHSVFADELAIVLKDIKIGSSRKEALKALADRLDIPEVTSFVVVIIDAEASGQSVGDVLSQQSIQMRLERLMRAEKAGAKASQLILIPIMLFILPAVLIMVLGPVILRFFSGGL